MKTVGSRKRLSLSAASNKLGLAATRRWGGSGGWERDARGREEEREIATHLTSKSSLGGSPWWAALLGRGAD